jgi:hypothetical protein
MRWLLAEAAQEAGDLDPLQLSFHEALEELGDLQPTLFRASGRQLRRVLRPRLLERVGHQRIPWRPGRHSRRPHDTQAKAKGRGQYQESGKLPETTAATVPYPGTAEPPEGTKAKNKPRRKKVA